MTDLLSARSLRKRFGERLVVADVDLAILEGQVTGLLGPNGAGKTTVFRMLAGLLLPDGGEVRLLGQDVTSWPLHRRARAGLGYLPQVPTVFRGLSARQNVELVLEEQNRTRGSAQACLDQAGIGHLAEARAENLSGGERRRLELARVLAQEPRVLMLDEPFAGVEPVSVSGIQERLRRLAAEGLAVLITDHAVREALGVCHRVIMIDEGTVRCVGDPETVAADPQVRARYLGGDFILPHSPSIARLAGRGSGQ